MNTETTLITGASSGIGFHLAHEFARHGHPLVVIAPVAAEIENVAAELRATHGIEARAIAADLREEEAIPRLRAELAGLPIDILVNNAGHGQRGEFWDYPLEQDVSMIRLNIEAVVRLTKEFLPPMVTRGRGRVLNVASIGGFMPGPKIAVYHATKAFVLSFSEALAVELADTGVSLTALCPGPTDTDFFEKADAEDAGLVHKAPVMAPQDVAAAGYKALMTGDRVIVPGAANKAIVFSRRFLPDFALAKVEDSLTEDVPPEQQRFARGDKEEAAALRST